MVELQGLKKSYGGLIAVNELSFTVQRGDAFGFIGPNGAGKTTTLCMLATLLKPDSGTATINGHDIREEPEAVRASVGYMPDFFGVYDDTKVWEYLDFFAAAYRVPPRRRKELIGDVLELTDLEVKREAYVDSLSRGMKQRLCLAKTLIHDPEVLLLDEPASGLDPRGRVEMRELLQELRKLNKTIIISSHIITELAELCNTVGIIEQGQLVMAGSVEEIAARTESGHHLVVRVRERAQECCDLLTTCPGIRGAEVADGQIDALYEGAPDEQHRVLTTLVLAGFEVQSFAEETANLEELYMRLTRGVVS